MQPTIGRIVEFHFTNSRGAKVVRPAIIVEAWSPRSPESLVNLQVFMDGADGVPGNDARDPADRWAGGMQWVTSVHGHQGDGVHPDGHSTWWCWPLAVQIAAGLRHVDGSVRHLGESPYKQPDADGFIEAPATPVEPGIARRDA